MASNRKLTTFTKRIQYTLRFLFTLLTALTLLRVAAAEELNPHEGFKGVRWGASVKDVLKAFPNAYPKPGVSRQREKIYFAGSYIGTIHVNLRLSFLDDKFAQVKMSFDRQESEHMVEVFEERYGKSVKKTSQGAIWHLNGVYIRLVQPAGTASITSQSYLDYDKASRVTAVKEAAKDL